MNFLKAFGNNITVLQCTSRYPTTPEHIGLNIIYEIKKKYHCPVGLSDHSGTIYPSIAAVTFGAEVIEVHVVFDKHMFGPDATSSLTISELKQLVEGITFVETSLTHKIDKNDNLQFRKIKNIFEKSISKTKY